MPAASPSASQVRASLSSRSMRGTSYTSKPMARWQAASTRSAPYRSHSRTSAWAWRIFDHGSGPPRSFWAKAPMDGPRSCAAATRASTLRRAYAVRVRG